MAAFLLLEILEMMCLVLSRLLFFSFLKTASASNFQWLHWDTWNLTVSSYAFKQGLCVSWCSLFCRGDSHIVWLGLVALKVFFWHSCPGVSKHHPPTKNTHTHPLSRSVFLLPNDDNTQSFCWMMRLCPSSVRRWVVMELKCPACRKYWLPVVPFKPLKW